MMGGFLGCPRKKTDPRAIFKPMFRCCGLVSVADCHLCCPVIDNHCLGIPVHANTPTLPLHPITGYPARIVTGGVMDNCFLVQFVYLKCSSYKFLLAYSRVAIFCCYVSLRFLCLSFSVFSYFLYSFKIHHQFIEKSCSMMNSSCFVLSLNILI